MNKGKWYAIHVFSQSEQKVKTLLEKTAVKKNVDDKIFEIVIPLDTEVKKKDGKKVECKTKVFPGYVLINMTLTDETFNFIRSTPGVTSFVSVNNKPVAMKDAEVKRILETLDPEKTVKPKKKWMKDMNIRICDGPFSDFTGKVEYINEEKETLRVLISIFGRDTPIEVDFNLVEKI
mgnify:CR=1 FL=1|jgi:transcriptional antiterminator NusG